MVNFFGAAALLVFVMLIYISAYRTGYKAAKSEAASVLKAYSEPITDLLDQIDQSLDKQIKNDRHRCKDQRFKDSD